MVGDAEIRKTLGRLPRLICTHTVPTYILLLDAVVSASLMRLDLTYRR